VLEWLYWQLFSLQVLGPEPQRVLAQGPLARRPLLASSQAL
jgi:hypothetical protein